MQEAIVQCNHCGSNTAYQLMKDNGQMSWSCINCGFTTNTNMLEGTESLAAAVETIPLIYKELAKTDEDGFVWIPVYKYVAGVGSVYAEGTDKDNWWWSAAPHVPLTEKEKRLFKDANGSQLHYREDFKNSKKFYKDDFILALQHLNLV